MSGFFNLLKHGAKRIISSGSKQKTYGTGAIKSVKTNVPTTDAAKKEAAHKIKMAKIPGEVFHKFEKANKTIDTALTKVRQDLQKIKGEKVTKSGFSKGKDIKND